MNGTTVASNDNVFSNGIDVENVPENNVVGDGTFGLAPGAERSQHSSVSSATAGLAATTLNGNINGNDAPGSSGLKQRQEVKSAKVVMDYSTDFPKLPDAPNASAPLPTNVWGRRPVIKSTEVTEAFKLSASERASRGLGKFGSASEEQHKCNSVALATGTKIELCEAKDQSLTILITGKVKDVEAARSRLVRELQTQATVQVSVPKEYHGHIIGKEGSRLRSLESEFLCKVFIPGRDDKSDIIRISGPGDYIGNAALKIREIADELAKQGNVSLDIPREFYPWIYGPANENLERIAKVAPSVKINIPPPNSNSETIIINGERSEVEYAAAEIRKIYLAKKDTNKMVTCKVSKAQHRFIIGSKRSGIDEILRETDVSVEVPAEDDESDTITLRGPSERLGDALALVYSKASSVIVQEINYPEWMRRFLIGPKGATLQQLIPNKEKLKVEFEDGGIIYLEGTPEAVKSANTALNNEIQRLNKEMASEIVKAPANLHRHIIGRNGAQVNKLKEANGVQITIPDENLRSDEIRIEGNKEGVKKAVATIKEIVTRLENEKSRDIIIEHRFHGQIIGKNGENVQKWRQQYPSVSISFPDVTNKSDIVNLRGDRKEVDDLYKAMTKVVKDLIESNYQETVSIFKDYYKHIVGKNGSNINRIREETKTRIELPAQDGGRITVIGKKADVQTAIALLNKIQNELESVVTVEVNVPNKIHNRLLNNGRRLIRDIEDEFGNVHILFPKEKGSDKVTIRGPKDDVAAAEKTLKEVAKHCEETTEELLISTKPEYIKFLIGRSGINVKKLREQYPSVRIVFPNDSDKEASNEILLLGKKEEVKAVKEYYEKQIAELNQTVEITMNVDPKYHRHFITRSAEVLKEIQNNNGGCQISFPKQDSGDSKVTIKGSKSCVESAKAKIEEIVGDLEAQVTINVNIPETHHRSLMSHLNDLRSKYNVRIKIPNRGTKNEDGEYVDGIGPADLIQITGRDTKCEQVKEILFSLIPVTKTVNVPLEYHTSLIGRNGDVVRSINTDHAVYVKIPKQEENSEEVQVTGVAENVDAAIADIKNRIVELDRQADERKLRSFKALVDVPVSYHQRLIGPRRSNILKISEHHNVQVIIPRKEDNSTTFTIVGYENDANACKEEIEKLVADWDTMITQEISLNTRFHPRLIGQRGRNLRKLEEQFSVEIRMPGRNDPNQEIVVIAGQNSDNVYECANHLRALEEDYIDELIDRGQYNPHAVEETNGVSEKQNQQVEITGAPWQLDNMEQFPAMGAKNALATEAPAPTPVTAGVWGQRRW